MFETLVVLVLNAQQSVVEKGGLVERRRDNRNVWMSIHGWEVRATWMQVVILRTQPQGKQENIQLQKCRDITKYSDQLRLHADLAQRGSP